MAWALSRKILVKTVWFIVNFRCMVKSVTAMTHNLSMSSESYHSQRFIVNVYGG
jgi:hypothetical protein